MKSYLSEIILAVILIALAVILWNPYWMPMGLIYVLVVCFVVALGGFAAFIWRARGGDERDVLIRQTASRIGYLAAAFVLAISIVWQSVTLHAADPWLLGAFVIAVVGKIAGYGYGKARY